MNTIQTLENVMYNIYSHCDQTTQNTFKSISHQWRQQAEFAEFKEYREVVNGRVSQLAEILSRVVVPNLLVCKSCDVLKQHVYKFQSDLTNTLPQELKQYSALPFFIEKALIHISRYHIRQ